MGEAMKAEIKLPVWAMGLLVTLLLALLAYNATFASTVAKVEQNTKSIELLQKDKADKETVEKIYNKLDKIETLLIDHMSKN